VSSDALKRVLGVSPESAEAALRLAHDHLDAARYGQAVAAALAALKLHPGSADGWLVLGIASRYLSAYDKAETALAEALKRAPLFAEAVKELAMVRYERGDYELAAEGFRRARALAPQDLGIAWLDLLAHPKFLADAGQALSAAERFQAGLDQATDLIKAHPQWDRALQTAAWIQPFHLHYHALDSEQLSFRYGDLLESVTDVHAAQFSAPIAAQPTRPRRRIGFTCSALRTHTVARYFAEWLLRLDQTRVELCVWNLSTALDSVSAEIRQAIAATYEVGKLDLREIARSIRDAHLDVLIHLDVGMDGRTNLLAAMRLAPVQCATYGHPVTTGSKRIDYFLSGEAMEPADGEAHYRERLVRLPGLGVLPRRPPAAGAAAWLPRDGERPLMLCVQNLIKIVPEFDSLAARIAARSNAIIVFFENEPAMIARFRARLGKSCAAEGIGVDTHFRIVPRRTYAEYLGGIAAADLVLDSIHFNGGSTSLDVLSQGTPLVTLQGNRMRGRQSSGMLRLLGVEELITADADGYVDLAIALAADRQRRDGLRRQLIATQDRLFTDTRVMPALTAFLENAAI
jgi:predicted O-linked N-acetylglucosamine transferase (SPINDLY family)